MCRILRADQKMEVLNRADNASPVSKVSPRYVSTRLVLHTDLSPANCDKIFPFSLHAFVVPETDLMARATYQICFLVVLPAGCRLVASPRDSVVAAKCFGRRKKQCRECQGKRCEVNKVHGDR